MDEYIKRDKALNALCQVSAPTPFESYIVEKCIDKVNNVPAEDVVLRSELAKEIFADIEQFIEDNKNGQYSPYGNYMGQCVSLGLFEDAFAELKKKYIQEDTLDARLSSASERSREAADNARSVEVLEKE